jgi:prepilin-type N-terminal cleavage/methylation domain-containing protein
MSCSFPLAEPSVISRQFSVRKLSGSVVFPAARHARWGAFTLIELLIVVAIIAVLAGLTLGTMGFVNRKGAESRARAEVAALAAAIESYKLEFGVYPLDATTLYADLTGSGTLNKSKVFFEPPPGMATNGRFVDPYGQNYNYTTTPTRNIGFFDLWCVPAGATNQGGWIHN